MLTHRQLRNKRPDVGPWRQRRTPWSDVCPSARVHFCQREQQGFATKLAVCTKVYTAPSNVIILYVLIRTPEVQPIQRCVNVNCPGNSSRFCGGDSWHTFHLMYLWVAPVKAICSGMPEPVENNMPTSTTICLGYFNEIVPCISTCPSICDLLLGKWAVRQRCFEIKCAGVSHVAHAEVQFLCQGWTENSGRDFKCIEEYTITFNTLKCKAVDLKTVLVTWTENVSCTSKTCGVPPSLANTTHLCGTTLPGHCHLQLQNWVFSNRIALWQERILIGMQI